MDVPGVIGRLGSALGASNINIAGFHLGRIKEGDKGRGCCKYRLATRYDKTIQTPREI